MTDEEIIKAMEICLSPGIPCDDCPLVEQPDCDEITRQYFYKRFKELKAENTALRERLEKAVNKRVVANMLAKYFDCPCNFSPIDEEMFDFCNECCNDDVICWEKVIEKSNAEARLAELKGGKE